MSTESNIVFVVDDDAGVRKALARLLRAEGFEVQCFSSAEEFLNKHDRNQPGCVLLDLAMPGLSGLELQQELAASGCDRSIVFITGHGGVPQTVRAMKAGAVDFLTKPLADKELLAAVRLAITSDLQARGERALLESIEQRLATLTPREKEVLERVVGGQLNKQIAAQLGIVEKTIKVHRARVMAKLAVETVAELVRLAERAGIAPVASQSQ